MYSKFPVSFGGKKESIDSFWVLFISPNFTDHGDEDDDDDDDFSFSISKRFVVPEFSGIEKLIAMLLLCGRSDESQVIIGDEAV
ncbi:hypothetical protein SDJN02_02074, partial [Cucurbita argyrosperma subsp. argyrosperma]